MLCIAPPLANGVATPPYMLPAEGAGAAAGCGGGMNAGSGPKQITVYFRVP